MKQKFDGNLREKYKENGFIIIKQLIPQAKTEYFRDSLSYMIEEKLKEENIQSGDPLHQGLIELDRKNHQKVVEVYETNRSSDALCQIIYDDKVSSIVKELLELNPRQNFHLLNHICRIDPPRDERFTYKWHQQSYYSIFEADEVQLWAPLVDRNTKEKGTMSILMGSHKKEVLHHIEKVPDGHIQLYIADKEVTSYEEVHIELNPGDVIFFHQYLIHRSNHNISNKVRYSLVASYVNPFDKRFSITDTSERREYHRKRCVNYREFMAKK